MPIAAIGAVGAGIGGLASAAGTVYGIVAGGGKGGTATSGQYIDGGYTYGATPPLTAEEKKFNTLQILTAEKIAAQDASASTVQANADFESNLNQRNVISIGGLIAAVCLLVWFLSSRKKNK